MHGEAINIGGIYADLDIKSGNMVRGLADARTAMAACERELRQLDAELKSGAISLPAYTARSNELNSTLSQLATRMEQAHANVQVTNGGLDIFSKRVGTATHNAANFGRGLMQLGYIADDIQYGFQGIVNNIGPLALSMSKGFGMTEGAANTLAAAIQIAGVAVYQLYKRWDDLQEAFGYSKTQTQAEILAELGKQASKTADEVERLYRAEKLRSGVTTLAHAMTESETSASKEATHAIVEAGVKDVIAGVRKNAPELLEGGEGVQAAKEDLERIRKQPLGTVNAKTGERSAPTEWEMEAHRRRVLDAQQKYEQSLDRAAATIVASGTLPDLFPANAKKIRDLVKAHPGDFGPHAGLLAEGLDKSVKEAAITPEDRAKAKKEKEDEKKEKEKDRIDKLWMKDAQQADKAKNEEVSQNYRIDKFFLQDAKQAELNSQKLTKEEQDALKKRRKEAYDRANQAIPGIDKMADDLTLQAWAKGGPNADVEIGASLSKMLREAKDADGKAFLDSDEAIWAAHAKAEEAKARMGNKVMNRMYHQDGQEGRASNSEVYNVNDLTHRIQSAISNDPTHAYHTKSLSNQDRMVNFLAQIAGRPFLNPGAKP